MVVSRALRCRVAVWGAVFLLSGVTSFAAEPWPTAVAVERQPLLAQAHRLVDALERLGSPLSAAARNQLAALESVDDDAAVTRGIESILDPLCAVAVGVAKDGPPAVAIRENTGALALVEQGWRTVLVKVVNTEELRARLRVGSPQARPLPHAPAADHNGR